jgi:hypothetical protein
MEKYGEIPKRFTKAWWSYFWDYYKLHTIFTAIILAAAVGTLVQCATRIHYDLQITYAGDVMYTDESISNLENIMSEDIEDITGNNKKELRIQQLTIAKEGTANAGSEYNMAMITKLDMEFQGADSYLYIFSGEQLNRMLNRQYSEDLFEEVSAWAKGGIDPALTSKKNGAEYAVSLKSNEYFEKLGFKTDDLYLLVRKIPQADVDKEKSVLNHDNAVRLANKIIGFGE